MRAFVATSSRGCVRGASYSWYMYSANRVKYPLIRSRLLKAWRKARESLAPIAAWRSIQRDEKIRDSYVSRRGAGGFVRAVAQAPGQRRLRGGGRTPGAALSRRLQADGAR